MIDRAHDLPISKQAEALNISRAGVLPATASACGRPGADAADQQAASGVSLRPFADVARSAGRRREQGRPSARENADAEDGDTKRVSAVRARPSPSPGTRLPVSAARHRDHAGEPSVGDGYHLHPDGARLRLSGGGARLVQPPGYIVAISITMDAAFCVETLQDALDRNGRPEIFNTDQGSQFTGAAFTGVLIENDIAISMDGKGAEPRQRLRRATVAQRQIRGGVSQSLRQRHRGPRFDWLLSRLL